MNVEAITQKLEILAPLEHQEGYDNAGLIVGRPDMEVTGVLVTLDSTEAVIQEAIQKNCNLIVAHHPIVFSGLKRFNEASYVERTVMLAIKHEIAIYATHTNLDKAWQGVNAKICERIGLQPKDFLAPETTDEHIGSGMLATLPEPMNELAFLKHLKRSMNLPLVRHTPLLGRQVRKVAVCGGAGSFLLPLALRAGADFFITADYKYHQFFDAEGRTVIADIGHYESEAFTIDLLADYIRGAFSGIVVKESDTNTNPVHYFV